MGQMKDETRFGKIRAELNTRAERKRRTRWNLIGLAVLAVMLMIFHDLPARTASTLQQLEAGAVEW